MLFVSFGLDKLAVALQSQIFSHQDVLMPRGVKGCPVSLTAAYVNTTRARVKLPRQLL